jgi:hypothetical protein
MTIRYCQVIGSNISAGPVRVTADLLGYKKGISLLKRQLEEKQNNAR